MGVLVSATCLADALGSLVGGPLLDLLGARWVFVIAASIMGLCLLAMVRFDRSAAPST